MSIFINDFLVMLFTFLSCLNFALAITNKYFLLNIEEAIYCMVSSVFYAIVLLIIKVVGNNG